VKTNEFFKECQEQSQIKTAIVTRYFSAWANVIIRSQKLHPGRASNRVGFVDLFAGPGRFDDGSESTPLLILRKAIENQDLRERLVAYFNDKNEEFSTQLRSAIGELPGIEQLHHPPVVDNEEVGSKLMSYFEGLRFIPTLFFVDPWGYKGLSIRLIGTFLKDWGCDGIFFFNYRRITMGVSNLLFREHMEQLFGAERCSSIENRLLGLMPIERELALIQEICEALCEVGGKYVLPFRFKDHLGTRTSHHLIFVSKSFKGYDIMKSIMAKEATSAAPGIGSFEYDPTKSSQPCLFNFSQSSEDLIASISYSFAGRTVSFRQLYEEHSVGTPFIEKDYRVALARMEEAGRVVIKTISEPQKKRRKGTFGDGVALYFPDGRN
jgi:three-Cys-motif partner protein